MAKCNKSKYGVGVIRVYQRVSKGVEGWQIKTAGGEWVGEIYQESFIVWQGWKE